MTNSQTLENDIICAVSTAPGIGGIAVVRVSGKGSIELCGRLWRGKPLEEAASHTAHFGTVTDKEGRELDDCVATVFRSPHTFTGEDTVEISVHGSRFIQRELLKSLCESGARIAEPGEFTRRAFASGRLDLAQAEAVADVIASNSRAAHRIALSQMSGGFSRRLAELRQKLIDLGALLELELDFSEEEVEFASRERLLQLAEEVNAEVTRLYKSFSGGQAIKEGIPVAIVGEANAGKSSLLNALLNDERAIVSAIAGTTRDTIEETLEIGDYLFRFIDTAGLRQTDNEIELAGIQRSKEAMRRARIIIRVVDALTEADSETEQSIRDSVKAETAPSIVIAVNKTDRLTDEETAAAVKKMELLCNEGAQNITVTAISAKTGAGLDELREILSETAEKESGGATEGLMITNARHAEALRRAGESSLLLIQSLKDGVSGDFVAQDLRETIHHLSTITGDITTPDILSAIFSRFCIGK